MTDEPLSVFESVNVVAMRPGDVLLFRCPKALSRNERAAAEVALDKLFGDFECVILDGGQDIAILRQEPGAFVKAFRWLFGRRGDE